MTLHRAGGAMDIVNDFVSPLEIHSNSFQYPYRNQELAATLE
jgi:hypothetical protein